MTTPKIPGMTPNTFPFSPALLGQSPAAHQLISKHRSPAPLQPGFSTPEAIASMGIGLTPSASGSAGNLGIPQISMAGMNMPPDESKKRELAEILRLLALRPGRISEEGVERLAKRMGLDCYKDTTIPGVTTLSLAAKIFLLDIDFRDSQIPRVTLSFAHPPGPSQEFAHLADAILHKNLSPNPKEHPPLIPPSLSAFADNLNRLAKIDCLSALPHLNCFTAITGLYTSLSRIFAHESTTLEGGAAAATCKGTGRPRMHARSKVGLSIDYWQEHRFTTPTPTTSTSEEDEDTPKTYRVLIEVEELPTDFTHLNPITPVRTSTEWVSDEIKKPSDSTDNLFGDSPDSDITDWLDPPLEELLETPVPARFVAVLDPPVPIPFVDELHLFNALMLAPPQGVNVDTLEALLFPSAARAAQNSSSSSSSSSSPLQATRTVFGPSSSSAAAAAEEAAVHRYRLYTGYKPVYARFISEVPFSHPKELVGVFQILRQFVFVGTLLRSCFDPLAPAPAAAAVDADENDDEDEDDLDAFMGDAKPAAEREVALTVDLSLGSGGAGAGGQQGGGGGGAFSLGVIFPVEERGLVSFGVEVGRNAEVRVVGVGDVDVAGVERAVVAVEDLGVVVEWVRRGGR
ncbi:hypothetical protein P167DRAFT_564580 [Morchella conica CCBAS932]|uniref:Mediator of RNA polymerase II transcription subunit 1 n=1 Tax=Morchella conica CCBAS932 TaxID=1392247 RepID=A0A3N4KYI2_9PEZI|nr:hypothetical protein P167DRAFT_564580 [Morchella conica CCBAS932]